MIQADNLHLIYAEKVALLDLRLGILPPDFLCDISAAGHRMERLVEAALEESRFECAWCCTDS